MYTRHIVCIHMTYVRCVAIVRSTPPEIDWLTTDLTTVVCVSKLSDIIATTLEICVVYVLLQSGENDRM